MTRAVVVGAGVGGLGAALALARSGHEVIVVERDRTEQPDSPSEAFDTWDRRGTPQARHSHAFLALLRNILRDRYPDVLEALRAAGASEIRFCDNLPETIKDRTARPGDDDLVALACRRTTFEWVLRRAVESESNVMLLSDRTVEALAADESVADDPPRVCGIRVLGPEGSPEEIAGDVFVIAAGHRSALTDWVEELGVELPVKEDDAGIVYLSRFYRLLDGAERPETTGPVAGDLDYLKYAVFQGDDRTFSVTLAVSSEDGELRSRLRDPSAFDRAAAALGPAAPWVDPQRSEAVTDVHVMAGLRNRKVDFLDENGNPLVLGLHAVGDCHTATNPLYGRGCPLAMLQAVLMTQALEENPTDPIERARAYERACDEHVTPWYHTALAQDTAARRALERQRVAASAVDTAKTDSDTVEPGDLARDIVRHGILPAARTDPEVFRAFLRSFNLLDPPERLMSDPAVSGPVMEAYAQRHERPEEAPLGPARDEMLALLSA